MNTQEVLSQLPQRAEVEQELNNYIESKQQELQEQVTAFQDSVAAFQQIRPSISQQQIEQEQQALSEMEASLRQFQMMIRSQIQQKRTSLLKPLYDQMDQAMAAVAEEKSLDFILNETTNTGEMVIFYSGNESLNVTEDVIQYIKENSDKN
ncbi:MAG TPA: OmpH family outer membrane protein [Balneolaceae bacterium]